MKIECVKNKLLEAVQRVEKFTGKNPTLPILSSISFETNNSQITLKATNLDVGIELNLPAKVFTPGGFAVSGSVLLHFLSNLPQGEKITIETVDSNIVISTEKTKTVIKAQENDEFPIIPKIAGGFSAEILPEDFVNGLRSVWYSAATTNMKPELSSVYIYQDGGDSLVFVSTDSFRLAEKKVRIKGMGSFESILIPFKNVTEVIRVLEGVKDKMELLVSSNQVAFSWDGVYVVSRIIEGTFPDYKQIIPKEAKTEAIVLKQDFLQILKLSNVFSDAFNQVSMRAIPGEKLFEIITRNNDIGESHSTLDAVLKGEDLTISFNYKYILDSFQSISADSINLLFHGLGKPLVVKGVSDPSFMYLVMPMNK
jgi:DNA polymerase-3 subunit beta